MSLVPFVITVLLLLVVTLISAVISALETALLSLKEHHIAVIGETRPDLSGMMRAMVRQPHRSVHQVILLGSVLNLALAVLGLLLLREFGPLFQHRPYFSALILFGALILIGELIPTLAALAAPVQVFQALVRPFVWFSPLLENISEKLESLTDRWTRLLLPFSLHKRRDLTDDEIETLVEMRRDDGALAPGESEIIQEIIRLGNKTVKDCLTPRVDTLMISEDATNDEVRGQLREAPKIFWFVPIFQGSPDVVVGMLDVKRWLYHPEVDFCQFIAPPVFVPETMNALEAFRDYLSVPRSLCVVLDEYGGVEGVLSHADIVEEILADTAPAPDHEVEIEELSPGHLRADGDARLDEIGEALGIDLDHEGLDTIGGLVFNELGHVPKPGTRVEIDGLRITVRRCQPQRVTAVEIEKLSGNGNGNEPRET
ncbi:MAG: HlyC/CorC family transporter [Verrucomicrobiae bacterium]|nr:HlyC/CorC family transporter [Verrucomicrobiae bacterium]